MRKAKNSAGVYKVAPPPWWGNRNKQLGKNIKLGRREGNGRREGEGKKGRGKKGKRMEVEGIGKARGTVGKEIKSVATLYTPGIARYLMTHLVDGSE